MRVQCILSSCLVLVCGPTLGASQPWHMTMLSDPIRLRYGEVYNDLQRKFKLPQEVIDHYGSGERDLAVIGTRADIVRFDAAGRESRVLLSDHYVHHFALIAGGRESMQKMDHAMQDRLWHHKLSGCHAMTRKGMQQLFASSKGDMRSVPFVSGAGAEFRHTEWSLQPPFRRVIHRPEMWTALVHLINTNRALPSQRAERPYSPLLECPCTPQRKIDVANGTIDGAPPNPPFHCSARFGRTGNPSCQLETYTGGFRCCDHGKFVIDTDKECTLPGCADLPADEVYLKVTWTYTDADNETRNVEPSACCDVTSDKQGDYNIEYDVPKCAVGTPDELCVHVVESIQPIGHFAGNHPHLASDVVDLVLAQPHLHVAGLSLELIDDLSNETLCEVHATRDNSGGIVYGTGVEPGNETGYVVGLRTCQWSGATAPRFRRDHPLRTRAVYNASLGHTGVMSLWLMEISPVHTSASDFII